ncbi:unnamed protein product [Linum trigynum]|uniref:S5 DRBM domain-containing protein n=1 Tax=Linum trigynum TaxID=586398 RepID=A0AAV2EAL1_9ROSI
MADRGDADRAGSERGRRGFGGRAGNRGKGRRHGGCREEEKWVPMIKLVCPVIRSLEQIYLHSLPIKEYQIIDALVGPGVLKDLVTTISPIQIQTRAGLRTRFKAFFVVSDGNGYAGLGIKCSKEVPIDAIVYVGGRRLLGASGACSY